MGLTTSFGKFARSQLLPQLHCLQRIHKTTVWELSFRELSVTIKASDGGSADEAAQGEEAEGQGGEAQEAGGGDRLLGGGWVGLGQ